jgi:peptidoglycan/xylan/chitin deacetylase (PgdA/CDA1 family)
MRHPLLLLAAAAAALAATFISAETAGAADCTPSLPERTLSIDTTTTVGFGTLQKFKPLPLAAGEFVLTFDDGPRDKTTPRILATLRQACLHATFFMIGRNAQSYPDVARAVLEQGHSVGSHSFSHPNLTSLPESEAVKEIKDGNDAVETAIYGRVREKAARFFRFPNNVATPALIAAARAMGMTIASYDITPADWRGTPPDQTLERFRAELSKKDRGVIVLHDAQGYTVQLLPMVLAELEKRHAKIVHIVPERHDED